MKPKDTDNLVNAANVFASELMKFNDQMMAKLQESGQSIDIEKEKEEAKKNAINLNAEIVSLQNKLKSL